MSTNLSVGLDINGVVCDTIDTSSIMRSVTLASNTVTNVVVPENVNCAFFSYGSSGDVWVSRSGNASIPGASFVSTTSELNPVSRFVVPGQTLSFICLFANPVQISFYRTRRG